ncbi:MAG TPA: tyrosine-type recombinase/integrase [Bacteroidia bacterium]|jgi:integrase/recombinase XerD|nr:tyrosine-type recombinase/integrase [Bacteroidia bacterium]
MKHLPVYNPDYQRMLEEFATVLQTKGYARWQMNTNMVREFLFFLECRGINDIKAVKATDIVAYYEYLKERPNQRRGGGLSNAMLKHHLFSVRIFFDYLTDTAQIEGSPARLPKFSIGKGKEREALTQEEIKELYRVTKNRRERAILSLAYGCGLRRSEIVDLNIGDVLLSKGLLTVRDGKGHKSRVIPLSDNVIKDLKEFVTYERRDRIIHNFAEQGFILNYIGQRASGGHLNDVIKDIAARTSIKKNVTPHVLRHSIATHLLDQGADIYFVKNLLGHACIDTSHIYSKRRKQKLTLKKAIYDNV